MGQGSVVLYLMRAPEKFSRHERLIQDALGRMIADLRGAAFVGAYDGQSTYDPPLYFLPTDALVREQATRLRIHSPADLFGGVVPYGFVATKVIAHPLVGPWAARPSGWSDAFAEAVQGLVVPGYTAFCHDDARVAARRLLGHGPIRFKSPLAAGGRGQVCVGTVEAADEALEAIDRDELAEAGLVVEANLRSVRTYSIGEVSLAGLTVSYYGEQRQTLDHRGKATYGGSDLVLYRGGYATLLRHPLPPRIRHAVLAAIAFDSATWHYDGLFASRRNYDVGHGLTARGHRVLGVFEQSWRVGGASGAELLALRAFHHEPQLRRIVASTVEVHGVHGEIPADAEIHFRGSDPAAGPLVCYSVVRRATVAA
jgi:hypothetical protein